MSIYFSESTLTSSSSDVQNLNQVERSKDVVPTISMIRSSNVAAKYLTTHSQRLRPEEDILYQWRLARKMEKARQGSGTFSKLPYMQDKTVDGILRSGKENTRSISMTGSYSDCVSIFCCLFKCRVLGICYGANKTRSFF